MQTLTKYCKTIKQAEKYQFTLYEKYSYVRLITFPIFTEDGVYIWEVNL